MAYDEGLAERIRELLDGRPDVVEKRMFGGLAFMVAGHMCCGVVGEVLMARVGPGEHARALRQPHVRPMDFTGRPMKGFVFVDADGVASDADLRRWVSACRPFVESLPAKRAPQGRRCAERER
jgi:hypothetical protein